MNIRNCKTKRIFQFFCVFLLTTAFLVCVRLLAASDTFPSRLRSAERVKGSPPRRCRIRQCTTTENEKNGQLFASFQPDWSGCYSDLYLTALDSAEQSSYTLIDIGANKAYAVATWLAFFSPQLGINQATLHRYLESKRTITYPCGSCNDCKDAPFNRNNMTTKPTLRIHAFEPQPDTVDLLKGVQGWMNISARSDSTFDVHGMAVSNFVGQALFKKCNVGNEVCSLDVSKAGGDQQVQVNVTTLDAFAAQHRLSMIDVMKIDTEGYEPWVFHGAQTLFREHRVRLFIFEYLRTGAWEKTSLPSEVSKLADLDYVCFMVGKTGLLLVTNCWNDKLNNTHSNLLCVSSRDRSLLSRVNRLALTGSAPVECT